MKGWIIAMSAAGALAAAGAYAQDRGVPDGPFGNGAGWRGGRAQMSADDLAAFTDARIAALHAGLKLTPDQEKLWPPVEEAIRGLAKQRTEARQARRERFTALREQGAGQDMPSMLRFMADRQAASAEALRKLADASQPLYGSLDEAQKRRLAILARGLRGGPAGMRQGRPDRGRWMQRGDLGAGGRDLAFGAPGRG